MSPYAQATAFERAVRGLSGGKLDARERRTVLTALQPSWTDCTFMDSTWVARSVTPSVKFRTQINFMRIATRWQVFARLFLVIAEYPMNLRRGVGLIRFGGQLDYAAFLTVNVASNSAGLT